MISADLECVSVEGGLLMHVYMCVYMSEKHLTRYQSGYRVLEDQRVRG